MTKVSISCDGCGMLENAIVRWTAMHFQGESDNPVGHLCPVCLEVVRRVFRIAGVRCAMLGEWADEGVKRGHVELYRIKYKDCTCVHEGRQE